MAIWQYTIIMLPKSKNLQDLLHKSNSLEDMAYEMTNFWELAPHKKDEFLFFNKVLPVGNSWNKDILVLGNTESNCIEVIGANNFVEEVIIRLDFRTVYTTILDYIIDFSIFNGMVLFDNNLYQLQLNKLFIDTCIKNSEQLQLFKALTFINEKD
ncbi:MAG: hypothetical protein MUE81_23470 [Thermoflexibacter sp.]|jgi:hypothetical protein|nr:hypothetical protein [Thermoflexibacter sp.]